ncbi:MAG: hypothetical protein ACP5FH_05110 [Terracidiphilus sp.]
MAVLFAVLTLAAPAGASSCTAQAELSPQDREALAAVSGQLAVAVQQQNLAELKGALLPGVEQDWQAIRDAIEASAPLMKNGKMELRNAYLLNASDLEKPADTQFFCTNAGGSMTVTLTMKALPPGRYALVLADAAGAPLRGQLAFILAWDTAANGWKLGGLAVRPGRLDGHDGLWWWRRARELAAADQVKPDPWSAWYAYEMARALLVPVDFLSSPNLDRLNAEQAEIPHSPANSFPLAIPDGDRTWTIDAVRPDLTMLHADLAVIYPSTGITDPGAQRTEAIAVLSAFLKAQPGLRQNFHGLWAFAVTGGKQTPVLELPMAQIP